MKLMLIEYLTDCKGFRERCAEEKPETSGKNSAYAESIGRVIRHIDSLPDDDPRFERLREVLEWDEFAEGSRWPKSEYEPYYQSMAVHCGPPGAVIEPGDCDEWLRVGWRPFVMRPSELGRGADRPR